MFGHVLWRATAARPGIRASVGIALGVGVVVCGRIGSAEDRQLRIYVSGSRPVAKAIVMLETQTGAIITYEDPRYEDPKQLAKMGIAVFAAGKELWDLMRRPDRSGVERARCRRPLR